MMLFGRKKKIEMPERFRVKAFTLWVDRAMTGIIVTGGLAVILAVFGIFFFILQETLPLFRGADVETTGRQVPAASSPNSASTAANPATANPATAFPRIVGVDEWGELPFEVVDGREVVFLSDSAPTRLTLGSGQPSAWQTARFRPGQMQLILGGNNGQAAISSVSYRQEFAAANQGTQGTQGSADQATSSRVVPALGELESFALLDPAPANLTVHDIDLGEKEDGRLFAAIVSSPELDSSAPAVSPQPDASAAQTPSSAAQTASPATPAASPQSPAPSSAAQTAASRSPRKRVAVLTMNKARSLFDDTGMEVGARLLLPLEGLPGEPRKVLVSNACDGVMVVTRCGALAWFLREDDSFRLAQVISDVFPAGDEIALAEWLPGGASLLVASQSGQLRVLGQYPQDNGSGQLVRRFGVMRELAPLPGAPTAYAPSLINRLFFIAAPGTLRLYHATSGDVRWEAPLDKPLDALAVNSKFSRLLAAEQGAGLREFRVEDPHPEAGLKSFFGKIWYEGYTKPGWEWQSTSASDDFEPKLSLTTLVFGTLKGTLYAMLFAVPIALGAALYTSQFMGPKMRGIVKPVIEIMASLPSVVLGFFAALYLAPMLEDRVPSILAMAAGIPLAAIAAGFAWGYVPVAWKNRLPRGIELMVMLPLFLLVCWGAWNFGPVAESWFFRVPGPDGIWGTPDDAASFRFWWNGLTGLPFEQRNSMIVGFVMGFAIIPVIFTIAEDALSNVPGALVAASEALGATRWQTVRRVVIPVASAGIFSAIIIGLGRAVGETMIVLMATGNTPIMDWNIFSGMRTLSANIATELPEAAPGSTHYRVLFLGGLMLFMMTFTLNSLAEWLRNHLREKYRV